MQASSTVVSNNSNGSIRSARHGITRLQTINNLFHIPATLVSFTVEYLSRLFSAVDKPQTSLKRPDIPVDERRFPEFRYFIKTLLINGHISADTLVHALIYLSRFHRRIARQQALVEEGAKHKLFLAALLVASKFCDDRYPLATISVCEFLPHGLVSLVEVNRMERAFLKVIRYKLIVDPDELALLLSKHGIDIRQIARVIAERTGASGGTAGYVEKSVVPPVVNAGMALAPPIPQRAVAGHSISARSVGGSSSMTGGSMGLISNVLSATTAMGTVRLATNSAATTVLQNAYLETTAGKGRSRRMSKPLPIQPS
ncbi:PHO85 cyclin-1 [Coemansia sp. BCRC 34301]|nr:PHO85 cyclin-1 [Coemansia sp. BCRC 34301]